MRERKYVKFRVDMYDDTKFKIIDRRPERDLINYVWNRVVVLAGKVNLDGELYLSKNIPYTIETLAIEFNRDVEQVKLALDVLIELEMLELTEHNIYVVKNFAKHQNIKIKEKDKSTDSEQGMRNKESEAKSEMCNKDSETENEIRKSKTDDDGNYKEFNLMCIGRNINKIDNNQKDNHVIKDKDYEENKINSSSSDNNPIFLETKKSKKTYKKKKKDSNIDIAGQEIEEEPIYLISQGDEDRHLKEGESVVGQWSF